MPAAPWRLKKVPLIRDDMILNCGLRSPPISTHMTVVKHRSAADLPHWKNWQRKESGVIFRISCGHVNPLDHLSLCTCSVGHEMQWFYRQCWTIHIPPILWRHYPDIRSKKRVKEQMRPKHPPMGYAKQLGYYTTAPTQINTKNALTSMTSKYLY